MKLSRRQLRRMISEAIAYTQDQKEKMVAGKQDGMGGYYRSIDDHMKRVASGYRYAHQKTNAQELRSEMDRLIDYRREGVYLEIGRAHV